MIDRLNPTKKSSNEEPMYWKVPGVDSPFNELENKLFIDFKVRERGLVDGKSNKPVFQSVGLSDAETEVVDRCQKAYDAVVTSCNNEVDRIETSMSESRLIPGEFDVETIKIESDTGIDVMLESAKQDLVNARLRERLLFRDLRFFSESNNLHREADYPESPLLPWAILVALISFESILNAYFFSKGSDLGLLGGWLQSIIVSLANVGVSYFIAGKLILRNLLHCNIRKNILSMVALALYLAGVVGFNLATAHYRVALEMNPDTAIVESIRRLISTPWSISNFDAIVLFVIGILSATVATYDGFRLSDDPYPNFGRVHRRHRNANEDYEKQKKDLRHRVEKALESAVLQIESRLSYSKVKMKNILSLLDSREKLKRDYECSADQIERICHRALRAYRENNQKVRSPGTAPSYFETYEHLERTPKPNFGTGASQISRIQVENDWKLLTEDANKAKRVLHEGIKGRFIYLENFLNEIEKDVSNRLLAEMVIDGGQGT